MSTINVLSMCRWSKSFPLALKVSKQKDNWWNSWQFFNMLDWTGLRLQQRFFPSHQENLQTETQTFSKSVQYFKYLKLLLLVFISPRNQWLMSNVKWFALGYKPTGKSLQFPLALLSFLGFHGSLFLFPGSQLHSHQQPPVSRNNR